METFYLVNGVERRTVRARSKSPSRRPGRKEAHLRRRLGSSASLSRRAERLEGPQYVVNRKSRTVIAQRDLEPIHLPQVGRRRRADRYKTIELYCLRFLDCVSSGLVRGGAGHRFHTPPRSLSLAIRNSPSGRVRFLSRGWEGRIQRR